ncbi:MAG: 16S rRNA (cytosine(1402)-N(4))-methyltransferase RsmH [Planctomycetota bacterium]
MASRKTSERRSGANRSDNGGGEGRGPVRVHVPVLPEESLRAMALERGCTVVDGTVGAGGHSELFCAELGAEGLLIGLDRDAEILGHALKRLFDQPRNGGPRIELRHAAHAELESVLTELGLPHVDRVFLDLGVSSLQLDSPERGFSFMRDAPLDMRMDPTRDRIPASDWLMRVRKDELERVLRDYGGERFAPRIASAIVEARRMHPIERTSQLAELCVRATPGRFRHGRIHAATRSFQAIRIAVNDELGHLERGLEAAWESLCVGGRLVVLSFHSLEDRIVKSFLKDRTRERTRSPERATEAEVASNSRSRSAKLRFGVKPSESGALS